MARRKCPLKALDRMERAFDVIHGTRIVVNDALGSKYDSVYIDHTESDGIIILFDDESNAPIGERGLSFLLNENTTAEEGMAYLRSVSV